MPNFPESISHVRLEHVHDEHPDNFIDIKIQQYQPFQGNLGKDHN